MRIGALAFAVAMSVAIVTPTFADSMKKSDPNEPGRRLVVNALPFVLPMPLFALFMMKKNQDAKKK